MVSVRADPTAARASQELECSAGGRPWQITAFSDRGVVRRENQDGWATAACADGSFAVLLADGMGGHADGAIAARIALEEAAAVLAVAPAPLDALSAAFAAADAAVARRGRDGSGCGTTLVVAVLHDAGCRVAHLGDSRAYAIGSAGATALTQDHSWVAEQERAGLLTAAQAAQDPRRNLLTRAVTGDGMEPDVIDATLAPGDLLLLCSDGLWGTVDEVALTALRNGTNPIGDLATLVGSAIAAGSTDNVTAVSCRTPPVASS